MISEALVNHRELQGLLDAICQVTLEACRADAVGIGLLDPPDDGAPGGFRWLATLGLESDLPSGRRGEPRQASPSGLCLEAGEAQLFTRPAHRFAAFRDLQPEILELVVAPLRAAGTAIGALWIARCSASRRLVADAPRRLERIAGMAANAIHLFREREQLVRSQQVAEREASRQREHVASLETSVRQAAEERAVDTASLGVLRTMVGEQVRAREQMEEINLELEGERRFWHSVLELLPAGVWVFNREDLRSSYCNSVGRAMFAEVLGGRDVRSVRAGELGLCDLNGEPRPSALLPMSRALSEGIPVQEEMLLGGFDGSRRIMVQAAPFFAHDRIVTHVIVALYDVTRLQALETFRQRWTSAIAHDIKTPLTASRLALQHLLMRITRLGSLSDTGTLQLLNRQIDRVIRLLNLMLDVSRLTEGRLTLDMRSHDYLSLAGAVVEEWQVAFPDASIQLETEVVPPLMVQMDGDRIEELLGNLLSNAIKYSVSSRPEVRVHVSVRGDRVITRIIDRGLGMSDEQARVIFDLYQRGGREQGPIDGEGLGAFVAYELAKMHGGLLTVERTSIGEGTTMLLELPVSAITRQVRESA